ncbi:MAG: alanyl-tRNA editing protein [Acidobacteria bacterium]|nr:alanyl-tRNA editing protein [Acidobacteriota bacterium]
MTRKLFWPEPYRQTLDTAVARVDGEQVTLQETIFFAFSGGQESDHGTIGGQPVLDARKDGFDIVYTVDGPPLAAGQPVQVAIDWERRYRLMRLHFAAELVLEFCYRRWPGVEKIGAHIAADKARIDFAMEASVGPFLPELAASVNTLVAGNFEIRSEFLDEALQRRRWVIDGFAEVACGGTHLRRTGEIGSVALKRDNIGKGKERVVIRVA